MANFSKYLGKDERVLNSIDMKDETIWSQNNAIAAEFKSWTTLVLTNKRFFSLNKRRLSMREFRLEDVVSTGWIHRPQWGRILWAILYFIIAAFIFIFSRRAGNFISETADSLTSFAGAGDGIITAGQAALYVVLIGCIFLFFGLLNLASYFYAKRTTFLMTTKDGHEYTFLLRGRSNRIDEFRMAVQDAKDLYIEENENRYFDKMRSVLFDQSNYEYALNNARPKHERLSEAEALKLESEKNILLNGSKNKQLPTADAPMLAESDKKMLAEVDDVLLLDSDGTLLLDVVKPYQLGDGKSDQSQTLQLKSSSSLADSTLKLKATDVLEKIGFEVSVIEEGDADLLLCRNNLRYIAIVDESSSNITQQQIDKVVYVKNHYKTDFGLLVSLGDLTHEVKEYAESCHVKIIPIIKTEEVNQL